MMTFKAWADVKQGQHSEAAYIEYQELMQQAQELGRKSGWAAYRFRDAHGDWPDFSWKPRGFVEPEPKAPEKADEYTRQCVYAGLELLQQLRGEESWWASARYKDVFDAAPPEIPAALLVGKSGGDDVPF